MAAAIANASHVPLVIFVLLLVAIMQTEIVKDADTNSRWVRTEGMPDGMEIDVEVPIQVRSEKFIKQINRIDCARWTTLTLRTFVRHGGT